MLLVLVLPHGTFAQENDDCLACHEDAELTGEVNARLISRTATIEINDDEVRNGLGHWMRYW